MALSDIVRSGVATANRLTASIQVPVTHEAFLAETQDSGPGYDTAVTRYAIAEEGAVPYRLPSGDTITTKAHLIFLSAVPIDARDRLTLPSGTTGRIVATDKGPVDPATGVLGAGYYREVYLA